jgi:hypothetical protein
LELKIDKRYERVPASAIRGRIIEVKQLTYKLEFVGGRGYEWSNVKYDIFEINNTGSIMTYRF